MKKLKSVFENPPKWLIGVLLVTALFFRLEHEFFNQKFHSDHQYIIICNIAYLSGNDFVSSYSNPDDVSQSIDRPTVDPEFYNYVSTFFTFLTNSNFWGIVLTSIFSIFIYFFAWILLFFFLKKYVSKAVILPFLLLLAFSPSPFLYYGGPDLFAKVLLWLAFALSIGIFESQRKWLYTILSAVVLGLVFWSRYAYYPLVPIIPGMLFLVYLFSKNKKFLSYAGVSVGAILAIAAFSLSIRAEGLDFFASGVKSDNENIGLQFSNLQKFNYSFFIQAFTDERAFYSLLNIAGLSFLVPYIKLLISLLVFALISLGVYGAFATVKKNFKENKLLFYSVATPVAFILATLFILTYLSIDRLPENSRSGVNWTHVQEARYYAPVFASLLFLALFFAYQRRKWTMGFVKKTMQYALWAFVILSVLYFPVTKYATVKAMPHYFSFGETKYLASQTDELEMLQALKKEIGESFNNGVRPLYLAHQHQANLGELFGAEYGGSVKDNLQTLQTSQAVNVIILRDLNKPKAQIEQHIKEKEMSPVWESDKYQIYNYILNPDSEAGNE